MERGSTRKLEVMAMQVTFIDGPLDGDVREVPEGKLFEGSVILIDTGDVGHPANSRGALGRLEYLYGGDGQARYVAGLLPG